MNYNFQKTLFFHFLFSVCRESQKGQGFTRLALFLCSPTASPTELDEGLQFWEVFLILFIIFNSNHAVLHFIISYSATAFSKLRFFSLSSLPPSSFVQSNFPTICLFPQFFPQSVDPWVSSTSCHGNQT